MVNSPTFRAISPKLTNLPNELLERIFEEIPKARDRIALASTSRQMRAAASYKTNEHVIRKQADADAAIEHRAIHVTFKNGNLVKNLVDMPHVKYLHINRTQLTELPKLPSTLVVLNCDFNRLVKLPPLPSTLIGLSCSYNKLVKLPTLPPNLKGLKCSSNALE